MYAISEDKKLNIMSEYDEILNGDCDIIIKRKNCCER